MQELCLAHELGLCEARDLDDVNEAIEHSNDPLLLEPGALYFYSSNAFNLLQGVVVKESGFGFDEYMAGLFRILSFIAPRPSPGPARR